MSHRLLAPALATSLATGCGAGAPVPAQRETPTGTADADWLIGTWQTEAGDASETWARVDERLVGVGFATRDGATTWFEVMVLHELDGAVLFTAMPGGTATVDFTATQLTAGRLEVANPAHDDPRRVRYTRNGDQLRVELDGDRGARTIELRRVAARPAPALADADRAFDTDSAARAGAAWAERFEPEAAMWPRGSERTTGLEQISAAIDGLAASGMSLRWAPAAAEFSAAGDMGFTSGPYTVRPSGGTETLRSGIYVTVWRRSPTGAWRIAFDTGVAAPAPQPEL